MSEESAAINELTLGIGDLTMGIGIAAQGVTEALLALQAVQNRAQETNKETLQELNAIGKSLATLSECVSPAYYSETADRDASFRVRHFLPEASENG
jgi:hypothetical protein